MSVRYSEDFRKEVVKAFMAGDKSTPQIAFLKKAAALFSEKEILLLDEPFSAMNKELEYKVTERLLGMGRTVIMITHNSDERYLKLFDNVVNIS